MIIPAYNVEKVLKDAVKSVLTQTYLHYILEIIIVNDGSMDQTLSVMEEIKEETTALPIILIHQANQGAAAARNAGIEAARGEWIALLDADDEWESDKMEQQIQCLIKHPQIDFLGCGHDGIQLKILHKKITSLYKASIKDICIKNFPVTPSIIFRKAIIAEIGGFHTEKKYMEDNDFCLRVCEHFNYYYLPLSLVRTGHGKKAIGDAGLSANIKGMYQGRVRNMKELLDRGSISTTFYIFCRIFNFTKYVIRRCLNKIQ